MARDRQVGGVLRILAAASVAVMAVAVVWAQSPADYTRRTSRPMGDVVAAVEEATRGRGFRVVSKHDLAASLAKEGIQREAYVVVEVCNAQIASGVLAAEPRIGSLMPCRISVYRQGDETVLTTVLPSRLLSLFPTAGIGEQATQVDQVLRAIIDAAAK